MFYKAFNLIGIRLVKRRTIYDSACWNVRLSWCRLCCRLQRSISLYWTLMFGRNLYSIFIFISPSSAIATCRHCAKLSLWCTSSKRRISDTLIVFWKGCMYQMRLGFHQTNGRWKLFDIRIIQPLPRRDILCGWKQ